MRFCQRALKTHRGEILFFVPKLNYEIYYGERKLKYQSITFLNTIHYIK